MCIIMPACQCHAIGADPSLAKAVPLPSMAGAARDGRAAASDIGRHIRALTDRYATLDAATARRPPHAAPDAVEHEMASLLDRVDGLERAAMDRAAGTLLDALAQATVCFHVIDRLASGVGDQNRARSDLESVLSAQASIVTRLGAFLGLDVDTLSWAGTRDACATELSARREAATIPVQGIPDTDWRDQAAGGTDAPLIALCADLCDAAEGLEALLRSAPTAEAEHAIAARVAEASATVDDLADKIEGAAVSTPAGLAAVAGAALALADRDATGAVRARDSADALAWRVVSSVAAGRA